MHKCWPLLVFAFLVVFSPAWAIGIAPASKSIELQPGESQSITYYAKNDGPEDMEVEAYIGSSIFQDVKIEPRRFIVPANTVQSEMPFTITFTTPKSLPAGDYDVPVGLIETGSSITGSGLSSMLAVESMLHAKNPFGAIVLKVSMLTNNVSVPGQPAYFYVRVENTLDYNIGPVTGKLTITDYQNREVYSTPLAAIKTIQSKNSTRITGTWGRTSAGRFTAVAELDYADGTSSASTAIQIGRPAVEVISINITQEGNIAVIATRVHNLWTAPVSVSTEMRSYYKETLVAAGESETAEVAPNDTGEMKIYADIKNRKSSDLDFDIFLIYEGQVTQQRVSSEGYFRETYQGPPLGSAIGTKLTLNIKPTYVISIILIIAALVLFRLYMDEGRRGRYGR